MSLIGDVAGQLPLYPDGLLTYVWGAKVRSTNPGCCYLKAGWEKHPDKPRSADGKKLLFRKRWDDRGVSPAKQARR